MVVMLVLFLVALYFLYLGNPGVEGFTQEIVQKSKSDLTSGKIVKNLGYGSIQDVTLTKVKFGSVKRSKWYEWRSKPYKIRAEARPKYTLAQGGVVVVGKAFRITAEGSTPEETRAAADANLNRVLKDLVAELKGNLMK